MSVQLLQNPVPGRHGHKRFDTDEPVTRCPRLSESSADAGLLSSSPGSPVSGAPLSVNSAHQGPARIGQYLLVPLADRPGVHSALDMDRGEELLCKVFDMGQYQEKIRAYSMLSSHKNIAQIKDIVLGESKAYVFQEKDFGDMHTFVKSSKRLPEDLASKLFHQVVSAVNHCHQVGIILGDLKLRKFVFSDEKRAQLKLEGLEDCHILCGEDDSMFETHGCPAYVSPEILNGGVCYSGKHADAWSLGVMLYTMLVGRYPFHDPDPATLFSKIRRGTYCLPDGLSLRARCLLRSLLRKDPGERLTTAEVLIHPWFNGNMQDTGKAEQEVNLGEQTVPQIEMEQDEDFFS
ncbi:tribbles homolog 1-like [Sinocyclocheilus grahami]|uniref:Tribbles pseudokinase 1 n=1 Tax=Sinocyclocheilus grahami TaxID=75366 RepID=A0A672SKB9_SINGR|nr:PREDICTED: tribbles homolog 1-like [Sinocyclocheilus grahami]XP_016094983.1 PREDICTED: tribbles homolog 1-like [Sinocyclocheilus grahami]